jgi:bifunctional UDP-N-acetylglucosamine pyrophosphorylase/glucosamine-1-phosphate N-acetyltransferase
MTASGSVITQDVPENALAVARARQVNKTDFVARLFEKLHFKKASQQKEMN